MPTDADNTAPTHPVGVLELLEIPDLDIWSKDGQIIVDGSRRAQRRWYGAIRRNLPLLRIHLAGLRTGHALAACTECGQVAATHTQDAHGQPRTSWPRCRMTPGCKGRHVATPSDVAARAHCPPRPKQPTPPRSVKKRKGPSPQSDPTDTPQEDQ